MREEESVVETTLRGPQQKAFPMKTASAPRRTKSHKGEGEIVA